MLAPSVISLKNHIASDKDYALDRTGGTIVPVLTSSTLQYPPTRLSWLSLLFNQHNHHPSYRPVPPRSVIEEDVHIGHCWKFSGPKGHIGVRLSEMILLTHFTVYFPDPKHLSTRELKEAPKQIRLWAASAPLSFKNAAEDLSMPLFPSIPSWKPFKSLPLQEDETFVLVANVVYDISTGSRQKFMIALERRTWTSLVVAEIIDNWGSEVTCLYSLTVHGRSRDWIPDVI
ncbi:hypothetical protein FB446DRAFT_643136 [Lentinula raphanica]|nr:hypothetical protein FB446DRAFT_643136 [Lentinula raphanica]